MGEECRIHAVDRMVVVAAIPVEGLAIMDRRATPGRASKVPLQRLVLCEKACLIPVCDDNNLPRPDELVYRLRRKLSVKMAKMMILAKRNKPRTMIVRHRDVHHEAAHDLVRAPHMYPRMRPHRSLPVSLSSTIVIATGHDRGHGHAASIMKTSGREDGTAGIDPTGTVTDLRPPRTEMNRLDGRRTGVTETEIETESGSESGSENGNGNGNGSENESVVGLVVTAVVPVVSRADGAIGKLPRMRMVSIRVIWHPELVDQRPKPTATMMTEKASVSGSVNATVSETVSGTEIGIVTGSETGTGTGTETGIVIEIVSGTASAAVTVIATKSLTATTTATTNENANDPAVIDPKTPTNPIPPGTAPPDAPSAAIARSCPPDRPPLKPKRTRILWSARRGIGNVCSRNSNVARRRCCPRSGNGRVHGAGGTRAAAMAEIVIGTGTGNAVSLVAGG